MRGDEGNRVGDGGLGGIPLRIEQDGRLRHAVCHGIVAHRVDLVDRLVGALPAAHDQRADASLPIELDGGVEPFGQRHRRRPVGVDLGAKDDGDVGRSAVVGGAEEADLQQRKDQCDHERADDDARSRAGVVGSHGLRAGDGAGEPDESGHDEY